MSEGLICMKARSCAALASGKSDSSVVSAYAEEGNVILFFFFPREALRGTAAGQEKEISAEKVWGQILPLCLEEV